MSVTKRATQDVSSVLDDFEGVSASSVMVPSGDDDKKKTSFFKRDGNSVFDNDDVDDDDQDDDGAGGAGAGAGAGATDDDQDDDQDDDDQDDDGDGSSLDDDIEEDDDENGKNKGGRPKALTSALQTLIDKKVLKPFEDDDKPISEYTVEDFVELVEANMEAGIEETAANAPLQVFKTLPKEVQGVVAYSLQGGENWKDVMKAAISVQETIELNPETEKDQEVICREWLLITGTLTPEEVEEEIATLKDTNQLEKKAKMYKPKLDAKQAEAMEKKLREQNEAKAREIEAAKHYKTSVYNTLNNTALNGIPLDPKVQNALFVGATEKRYTDKKGNPTNELGYLLEQHQFGEKPNHSLILEALWLLRDPEGYREKLIQMGEAKSTLKTRRDLRAADADKSGSSPATGNGGNGTGVKRRSSQQPGTPGKAPAAPGVARIFKRG